MNDPQKLRELSWRRRLTGVEEAALRDALQDAASKADLETDVLLTEGLARLPDVPVSNNFTSRVLQAVERDHAAQKRAVVTRWAWGRWFPRVALGLSGVLSILAITSLVSHHQEAQAREFARSLTAVSGVVSLPSPEVLQDFEAIRHLNAAPPPDEQLLALFE